MLIAGEMVDRGWCSDNAHAAIELKYKIRNLAKFSYM
jgi:hypothetical protein